MNLNEFVEKHCTGREYDSCVESPCQYASHSGCRHPLHPSNNPIPRIHKIHITKKEIEVFLNDGRVRLYKNNPKRLAWLSKIPGYYVSTLEDLGYGFSASILKQ